MMKKPASLIAIFVVSVILTGASAQKQSVIPIENGERWWGAASSMGSEMPLNKPTGLKALSSRNYGAQVAPLLISSYGRFVWSDGPFDLTFDGKQIVLDATGELRATQAGRSLREAYVTARNRYFKGNGKTPDPVFFGKPIYNIRTDLAQGPSQSDVEKYADEVLANGFPAGIIIIDQGWQKYNGNFEFESGNFPDPKAMIDRLHGKGFKVMLWVSPFVSADSREYRDFGKRGLLIREKGVDHPAIIRWPGGMSACFDLTNRAATDYLAAALKDLQTKYGIDGFKFDGGDFDFYDPAKQDFFAGGALPAEQARKWAELGLRFPLSEHRACWGMQGEALIQRMADKERSWAGLSLLISEMINAGLMGYAYTCPDEIGGHGSDLPTEMDAVDQNLIVRFAQLHAMMPVMQFSVAPWKILDEGHLKYCADAVKLHEKFAPYITELAQASALTGEPIVRHMEYMFPAKGFSDCTDQFMLGTKYLVAPILTADGKRTVRLPNGTWIDDRGVRIKGPLVLNIQAETGRLPYFEYQGIIKEPKPVAVKKTTVRKRKK